ncbi:MAG: 23S rRNA (adenine(2503)-C(2))-methyltransferase RlmN [Clostridiales bacterium]|nr:23S rRNA (adenine(2503)-C(2))-methyltransferase RlmN [Clostridiales bacterium]
MEDLVSLSYEELSDFIKEQGEASYRAEQIFRNYAFGLSLSEMTDIGKNLKEKLSLYENSAIEEVKRLISRDGTEKYLFRLRDGNYIETVLMRYKHGNSVCISSQVGCRMGCRFCASTLKGKIRNLSAGEMLMQVSVVNRDNKVSNIVIMGVGEPLDNYDNLLRFLKNVNDPRGMNIGQRHISVSTCGLADKIKALAEEKFQITLSVSLHAPDNETRNKLMPVNLKYGVEEVLDACRYYISRTGRRISFEYTLIKGVNDAVEQAETLGRKLKGMLCHVNLIPVNYVSERGLFPSDKKTIDAFRDKLLAMKINTTVRRTLGGEINASCGQLRYQQEEDERRERL